MQQLTRNESANEVDSLTSFTALPGRMAGIARGIYDEGKSTEYYRCDALCVEHFPTVLISDPCPSTSVLSKIHLHDPIVEPQKCDACSLSSVHPEDSSHKSLSFQKGSLIGTYPDVVAVVVILVGAIFIAIGQFKILNEQGLRKQCTVCTVGIVVSNNERPMPNESISKFVSVIFAGSKAATNFNTFFTMCNLAVSIFLDLVREWRECFFIRVFFHFAIRTFVSAEYSRWFPSSLSTVRPSSTLRTGRYNFNYFLR